MSVTKSHKQNLALSRCKNSRAIKKKYSSYEHLLTWISCFTFFFSLLMSSAVLSDTPVFEIGKFSSNPRKQVPQIEPMADLLAEKMALFGYESGAASVFADFDSARQALRDGKLDMLTTSLFEAAQLIRGGEASPLAEKWKNGLSEYSSLIVVDKESDIYQLEDLLGKTIAFEDPGSTTAFFAPYMEIFNRGLPLTPLIIGASEIDQDKVHYRFSEAEQNSSALLFQKKVDAIALSDYDWLKTDHVPSSQRENFRIIWISEPFPAALEVINSQIPAEQKAYLRNTLIRIHLSVDAEEALDQYHEASRFSRLSDSNREQLDLFIEFLNNEHLPL